MRAWLRAWPVFDSGGPPVSTFNTPGGSAASAVPAGLRIAAGLFSVLALSGLLSLQVSVPGAWTPQVAGTDIDADAIFPVHGQMVEVDGRAGAFDAVVYGRGGYVVPRGDGRVVAGSTMERQGFQKGVTVGGLAKVLSMVGALVPSLQTATVRSSWAGLRPGSRDGLPLLGQQSSGLWLASGHFRNGVLLAAISGERLAGALLRQEPIDDAFSPRRFSRPPS